MFRAAALSLPWLQAAGQPVVKKSQSGAVAYPIVHDHIGPCGAASLAARRQEMPAKSAGEPPVILEGTEVLTLRRPYADLL
jgi:hypothetical protein